MIATRATDERAAIVLDTSVWIAAYLAAEPEHATCRRLLAALAARRRTVVVPDLVRLELACAAARRVDESYARAVLAAVATLPFVRPQPLDHAMLPVAAETGMRLRLRSLDAALLASARWARATLISLDRELLDRGDAVTPGAWLRAHERGAADG